MADLLAIAEANDFDDVLVELTDVFGDAAMLFAIDHAFDRLIEVRRDHSRSESMELQGELRVSMLENRSHVDGDVRWTPISDRQQPVLVVRTPASAVAPSDDMLALLGPIVHGHRSRFEELERVRRRSQMSDAAEMQWASLPIRADVLDGHEIGSVLEPAYEVAGDAFDYAAADGAVWAYSLDGMGHGIAATTASILALSAIRNARRTGGDLAVQMETANTVLFDQFGGGCFVTGVACRIDSDGVHFVNAGHEPAWWITHGVAAQLDLEAELPLGVVGDHRYRVQSRPRLEPGDGVALFSDGPVNSRAPDGAPYTSDRLRRMIESRWTDTPLRTAHDVIGDVIDFIGGGRVADDITAVVVRRQRAAEVS
jgi:hypothetical protein